jgi:hypothetical protein
MKKLLIILMLVCIFISLVSCAPADNRPRLYDQNGTSTDSFDQKISTIYGNDFYDGAYRYSSYIIIDNETGINYLVIDNYDGVAITPRLNPDWSIYITD